MNIVISRNLHVWKNAEVVHANNYKSRTYMFDCNLHKWFKRKVVPKKDHLKNGGHFWYEIDAQQVPKTIRLTALLHQ